MKIASPRCVAQLLTQTSQIIPSGVANHLLPKRLAQTISVEGGRTERHISYLTDEGSHQMLQGHIPLPGVER